MARLQINFISQPAKKRILKAKIRMKKKEEKRENFLNNQMFQFIQLKTMPFNQLLY